MQVLTWEGFYVVNCLKLNLKAFLIVLHVSLITCLTILGKVQQYQHFGVGG